MNRSTKFKAYLLFSMMPFAPIEAMENNSSESLSTTISLQETREKFRCDFPNIFSFLPEDEAIDYLEQSCSSILPRLKIPYVDPKTGKITEDDFIVTLNNLIQEMAPGAKVYISGGVVRSLLGYIYKRLYHSYDWFVGNEGNQENGEDKANWMRKIFDQIILGEHQKTNFMDDMFRLPKDLPSLKVLGINSDMDFLIEFPEDFTGDRKKVMYKATDFINSAESYYQLRFNKSVMKKSLVPVGDVKDFHEQLGGKGSRSAVAQGGATLDWLAFPITRAQPQKMRYPEGQDRILNKFVQGELVYLAPETGVKLEEKQCVRGLRSLFEIPFLMLNDQSSSILQAELTALTKKAEAGERLDTSTWEQFEEKMIRNARFGGAHNRFAGPHASMNDGELRTTVQTLSKALETTYDKKYPIIPEFLPTKKIRERTEDKGNLQAKGYLVSLEEFLANDTDNGIIYHGTPDFKNILPIIRNGLYVSATTQGVAAYGYGTYAAKDKPTAQGYAKDTGIVVPLSISSSSSLRILDLNTAKGQELLQRVENKYPSDDPYRALATYYDIDIIIARESRYILLQNSDAVVLPKDAGRLIKLQVDQVVQELQDKLDSNYFYLGGVERYIEFVHPHQGYTQMLAMMDPSYSSKGFDLLVHLLERRFDKRCDLPKAAQAYEILKFGTCFKEITKKSQELYQKALDIFVGYLNLDATKVDLGIQFVGRIKELSGSKEEPVNLIQDIMGKYASIIEEIADIPASFKYSSEALFLLEMARLGYDYLNKQDIKDKEIRKNFYEQYMRLIGENPLSSDWFELLFHKLKGRSVQEVTALLSSMNFALKYYFGPQSYLACNILLNMLEKHDMKSLIDIFSLLQDFPPKIDSNSPFYGGEIMFSYAERFVMKFPYTIEDKEIRKRFYEQYMNLIHEKNLDEDCIELLLHKLKRVPLQEVTTILSSMDITLQSYFEPKRYDGRDILKNMLENHDIKVLSRIFDFLGKFRYEIDSESKFYEGKRIFSLAEKMIIGFPYIVEDKENINLPFLLNDERKVLAFFEKLQSALVYFNEQGIVHKDVRKAFYEEYIRFIFEQNSSGQAGDVNQYYIEELFKKYKEKPIPEMIDILSMLNKIKQEIQSFMVVNNDQDDYDDLSSVLFSIISLPNLENIFKWLQFVNHNNLIIDDLSLFFHSMDKLQYSEGLAKNILSSM